MSPNAERIFARAYRPTIVVLLVLAGSAWAVLLAVGKFTSMVDSRAQAVVEHFAAAPLAEHKDFERRIAQNTADVRALTAAVKATDETVNRVLGAMEEQRAQARRGDIPVRALGVGR